MNRRTEIIRDRYGVPHVFADDLFDLFFGFGFAIGQDRLWQLEFCRRRAAGTLAEILGRAVLPSDTIARTIGFARIAEQEIARLSPEARQCLDGYAEGINAAIAACADNLPVEFDVLDVEPALWTVLDTLTIGRANNWQFSGRIEGIVLAEAASRLLPPHLVERFLAVELAGETIVPGPGGLDPNRAGIVAPGSAEPQGSNQWAVAGHIDSN